MNQEENILEVGLLHRTMVLFHRPAAWTTWQLVVIELALAAGVGLVWALLGAPPRITVAVAVTQTLFFGLDAGLLRQLPERRVSHGPWKPQSLVLALARVWVGIVLSIAGLWIGWPVALAVAIGAQVCGSGLLYWAAVVEPSDLALTHQEIGLTQFPASAPPLRVLHISDIHVERAGKREERLLALVEEAQADLIVVTGDYVNLSFNEDPDTLRQIRDLLDELDAPLGVYATLGSPPVDLRHTIVPLFDGSPIRLLRDDRVMIDAGHGRRLQVLGLDCSHFLERDGARLARLMADTDPKDGPVLLLYHSPELMPEAVSHGIDIYVCGHTHGGQVRVPWLGPVITSSQLGRRYVMGHYHEGTTHLYVSRGIGLEGLSAPRVRFLSPPEVTVVTLRGIRDERQQGA